MKKLLIAVLLLVSTVCGAQDLQSRHLVRLGYGDALFEKLVFYPSAGTSNYAYTGHLFADYQYSFTRVVSVGAQLDFQGIFWTTEEKTRSRNYDLCLIPTLRFTWLHTSWVRLYSGLGGGVLMAFDNAGNTEFAPVFDLKPVGIQLGKTHWCGSLDLGFMAAMKSVNRIYMAGSRLVSVSVNYRW